jgi:hypothetical protein
MKEHEMGGACDLCGREDKWIQGFGGENVRNETTWKTGGRIILKLI